MKRFLLVVVGLAAVWGCQGNGVLGRELTSRAHQIFAAAARRDSATIGALVVDSVAFTRVHVFAERDSVLVRLAGERMRAKQPWQRGDTAGAIFTVPTPTGEEALQMTFIRKDGEWRLLYLTLANRTDDTGG